MANDGAVRLSWLARRILRRDADFRFLGTAMAKCGASVRRFILGVKQFFSRC
ncbi:MAG: hypothetical protein V3V08_02025 [Nannocystaceae bacterium]